MVKQCWQTTDGSEFVCFQKILVCQQRYIFQKTLLIFSVFFLVLMTNFTSMFLQSNSIVNIAFYDSTVKRSCQIFLNCSDSESLIDKCIIQTKLFFSIDSPQTHMRCNWNGSKKRPFAMCGYLLLELTVSVFRLLYHL